MQLKQEDQKFREYDVFPPAVQKILNAMQSWTQYLSWLPSNYTDIYKYPGTVLPLLLVKNQSGGQFGTW